MKKRLRCSALYADIVKCYGEPTLQERKEKYQVRVTATWMILHENKNTVQLTYTTDLQSFKRRITNEEKIFLSFPNHNEEVRDVIKNTYKNKTASEILELYYYAMDDTYNKD